MRTAKTLIRLGGCPGWSESSLGAHAKLLVLLWGDSFLADSVKNSNALKLFYEIFKAWKCHVRKKTWPSHDIFTNLPATQVWNCEYLKYHTRRSQSDDKNAEQLENFYPVMIIPCTFSPLCLCTTPKNVATDPAPSRHIFVMKFTVI